MFFLCLDTGIFITRIWCKQKRLENQCSWIFQILLGLIVVTDILNAFLLDAFAMITEEDFYELIIFVAVPKTQEDSAEDIKEQLMVYPFDKHLDDW